MPDDLGTRLLNLQTANSQNPVIRQLGEFLAGIPAPEGPSIIGGLRDTGLGFLNMMQFGREGGTLTPKDVLSVPAAGGVAGVLGGPRGAALAAGARRPNIRFARGKVRKGDPIDKELTAVDVDVGKLTRAARRDKDFFVETSPTSVKQQQFLEFAAQNEAALPVVGLTKSGKNPIVGFDDGRNRFAALRGLGLKTVPVAVDKRQAAEFRRLFAPD